MDRIAIFTTDLYQGGVSESTRKIVKLVEREFLVDIIVYDNTPIMKEIPSSVRVLRINMPLSAGFAMTRLGRTLKRVFRGPGLIYAFLYLLVYKVLVRPHTTYSMMYIPNLLNILTGLVVGGQVIASERQDPRMDLQRSPLLAKLLKATYRYADGIHANSPGMVTAIREFYGIDPSRIYFVPNFFDIDEIKAASRESPEKLMRLNKFNIATSGRLSKQKGHWHLIAALSKMKRDDISLFILGDGELKAELVGLAKSLGVDGRVFFLGNVTNPHAYIGRCDVFVFPSIWESFGNALVEAMALSLPVVSTTCPSGPGDIIDWGKYGIDIGSLPEYENKYLDETEDYMSRLCDGIEKLRRDRGLREYYSKRSDERAEDFSVSTTRNAFIKMLFCRR